MTSNAPPMYKGDPGAGFAPAVVPVCGRVNHAGCGLFFVQGSHGADRNKTGCKHRQSFARVKLIGAK
jgi:hypothetical protein